MSGLSLIEKLRELEQCKHLLTSKEYKTTKRAILKRLASTILRPPHLAYPNRVERSFRISKNRARPLHDHIWSIMSAMAKLTKSRSTIRAYFIRQIVEIGRICGPG